MKNIKKRHRQFILKLPALLVPISLVFFFIITHSCYYDSEEYLFPSIDSQCDTLNVTFSGSISPVLQNNCLSCHGNTTAAAFGGNIRLESYADVKVRVDDHRLYGSIAHESGYSPMPMGASKLSDCAIAAFRIWIGSGAPNN